MAEDENKKVEEIKNDGERAVHEHKEHHEHSSHEHSEHHEHSGHKEHHSQEHKEPANATAKSNVVVWQVVCAILGIILIIAVVAILNKPAQIQSGIPSEEAGTKAITFINENILQNGQAAELIGTTEENGLYKIKISVQGQEFDSYISKDGKILFPSALDMDSNVYKNTGSGNTTGQTKPATADLPKAEMPQVELFVMSHCPYGTQIEKGMLPVAKLLGDKIDFKVKFVYYAMHGKTEVDEQLRQYCIQKEQTGKYIDYLSCFLGEGKSDECITAAKVDSAKMQSCVKAADAEFKVSENYNDQSKWLSGRYPLFDVFKEDNEKYGVGGSPTLIINGKEASSARDSASLLANVCAGFENPPDECSQKLSSAAPSAGFGYEPGTETQASCG